MVERVIGHFRRAKLTSFQTPTEASWESEQRAEAYLATLDKATRVNVTRFVDFARELQPRMGETRIAVIAVGSSTRPEERNHPVHDIDLRILNSAEPVSEARLATIRTIGDAVRDYLQSAQIPSVESRRTANESMVPADSWLGKSFEDFYNRDPSFTTKLGDGLPLHISLSGADNFALDQYLQIEKDRGTSTVLLVKP